MLPFVLFWVIIITLAASFVAVSRQTSEMSRLEAPGLQSLCFCCSRPPFWPQPKAGSSCVSCLAERQPLPGPSLRLLFPICPAGGGGPACWQRDKPWFLDASEFELLSSPTGCGRGGLWHQDKNWARGDLGGGAGFCRGTWLVFAGAAGRPSALACTFRPSGALGEGAPMPRWLLFLRRKF